ncbi:MAG: hypothetical protein K5877_09345 [Lachnospiraceae bacterium]|nr:hypothetical protein [Lachnospiraceae bacterium]
MEHKESCYIEYGPRNLFWLMDHYNDIHIRFSASLDHEIDSALMENAWEKTIAVYPVIGCVIEMEGKNLFFYRAKGRNKAIRSKAPINPGSDLVSGCVITATYYGNCVYLSAYHTMVDGGGLCEIFKTLLYFYLSGYTGIADTPQSVQITEGRPPEAYYKTVLQENMNDFTPVPIHYMPYLRDYAEDTQMDNDEDGNRYFGALRFPMDSFMSKAKELGANPTAMLGLLTARVFYALNPNERKDIFFEITTSARKVFHSEGCISNCVSNVIAGAEYEAVMAEDVKPFIKDFRKEVDLQRGTDYVKTMRLFDGTYGHNYVNKQITLTYIGGIDIGENTAHMRGFWMETNASSLVMLVGLLDEFQLMLQLGKATKKYLAKYDELLRKMGIDSRIVIEARTVVTDSDNAVLD